MGSIKAEPKLHINQLVEFVGWSDDEDHKDGPAQGDTGLLTDIISSAPQESTVYAVIYKPFTPFARTIHHTSEEIQPLVDMEVSSYDSRTSSFDVPTRRPRRA